MNPEVDRNTEETADAAVVVAPLYMKYLSQMDQEQLGTIWSSCYENGLIPLPLAEDTEIDTTNLANLLQDVPHVDVITALGGTPDAKILEILMSQPLTREIPKRDPQSSPHTRPNGSKSAGRAKATYEPGIKGPTPSPDDPRILSFVEPNPKKPSSAAFTRYAHYKTGMSVAEFIKAGGTKGDVQYDLAKGFIKLVSPEEWTAQNQG